MKIIVPPIKIQWIKTKLVEFIISYVDFNDSWKWIEPFMWSGVVWFNFAPKNALFCDTNPHTIKLYQWLNEWKIDHLDVKNHLEKEWKILSEKWVEHYNFIRARFNEEWNPLDFIFINRSCFNWMIRFNRKWWFNVPFCKKPDRFAQSYVTKITNQVKNIQSLMKQNNWEFICQDFRETIKNASKNDLIYCDPPYIWRHVDYFDSWNEQDEFDLHQWLTTFWWKFIMSTWHSNDYRANEYLNTLWNDCIIQTTQHFYHVWWKEKNRNPVTEAIVMNYSKDIPIESIVEKWKNRIILQDKLIHV